MKKQPSAGFTLVELIIVIVILGILSVAAAPRFIDISTDAKVSKLNSIASQIKTTIRLIQSKAIVSGLSMNSGALRPQSEYIVDFGFGSVELSQRNLCPEPIAELGDGLNFIDFMNIDLDGQITYRLTNTDALIGFDVPASDTPIDQGCYVLYDATSDCRVTVISTDC